MLLTSLVDPHKAGDKNATAENPKVSLIMPATRGSGDLHLLNLT